MPLALTLSTDQQPAPPLTARSALAGKPQPIAPAIKQAIALMIEDGLAYPDAAAKAGIPTRRLRQAIEKPHVINYMRAQREVFRTSISAANIKRLAEIRDAANNMPAVNAIKALEQIDEQQQAHSGRAPVLPGFVIVVQASSSPMPHMREIEAKPLIDNALGHSERVGTTPSDAQEDP